MDTGAAQEPARGGSPPITGCAAVATRGSESPATIRRRRRRQRRRPAAGSAVALREPDVRSPEEPDDALDEEELREFLQSRPTVEQLVQQNILRDAQADGLRRAAAATELGRLLRVRPSPEELVDKNVLKASVAGSPALAALSDSVSKLQHRDFLARSLRRKPALDELVRRNIYRSREGDGPQAPLAAAGASAAALLSDFMVKKRLPVGDLLRAELSKRVMMWTSMPVGSAPSPRNCHTWTLVGQKLFMAGGFIQPPDPPCLPLAALDLNASEWSQPAACYGAPLPALLPSARYAHSTVGFQNAFLVVFGGYGAAGKWLNDVWVADVRSSHLDAACSSADVTVQSDADAAVDTSDGGAGVSVSPFAPGAAVSHIATGGSGGGGWPHSVTWHAATPVGAQPSPRAAHTAVLFDGCMLVFGGNDGSALFNDSWLLPLVGGVLEWQALAHLGTPPTPRSGHSSVMFKAQMVVFGGGEGWGGHCFNDLYVGKVDVSARRVAWMRPSFSGTPPPPRTGHTASVIDGKMFVFGGGDARRALNDVHVCDLSAMAWSRPADTGVLPSPRAGHAAVTLGTFVAVFGGASPDGTAFNDLHLLDTSYSLYDDGGATSDSSVGAVTAACRPSLLKVTRRAVEEPSTESSPAAGVHASPTASASALSRSLVTQSDNEARLPQRVLVSRVPVIAARPTVHSLDSIRSAMGSGAPIPRPVAAAGALGSHGMVMRAALPPSTEGGPAATLPSGDSAQRLLVLISEQRDADDRRFSALSAHIESLQSERRAEYALLTSLVQGMIANKQ